VTNMRIRESKSALIKTEFVHFGLLILLVTNLTQAEESSLPTGRPAALDKLEYRVGVWDIEAKCRFSPDGKLFNGKGVETVRWSPNNQFLIADQWMLVPSGWLPKLVITSWDPMKNEFKLTNVLPNATYTTTMNVNSTNGRTFSETKDGGHTTRTWTTIEQVSLTKMRTRTECSIDGGPVWTLAEEIAVKRSVGQSNLN
jgi:hypothetical protein